MHAGLYRYKRFHYGTNASTEILQYTLPTQLQGLNGVANIADDIIVFAVNLTEHDENFEKYSVEKGHTRRGVAHREIFPVAPQNRAE